MASICEVTESGCYAKSTAASKSMSDSSRSKDKLREATAAYRLENVGLKFPSARDLPSPPPRLTPTEFVEWCEKMMPAMNIPSDPPEKRVAQKTSKAFVL